MPKPRDWLFFAQSDLVTAKLSLQDELALASVFYHSQQCAEKALKAFLVFQKKPVTKTHDLQYLIELCAELDEEFNDFLADADLLNPYSIVTRYPDDYFVMPSIDTAIICIQKTENIYTFVRKKISEKE